MSNKLIKHAIKKIASKYGIEIETRYDMESDCAERFYYFNGIYTGIDTKCPLEQIYMELYWGNEQYTRQSKQQSKERGGMDEKSKKTVSIKN